MATMTRAGMEGMTLTVIIAIVIALIVGILLIAIQYGIIEQARSGTEQTSEETKDRAGEETGSTSSQFEDAVSGARSIGSRLEDLGVFQNTDSGSSTGGDGTGDTGGDGTGGDGDGGRQDPLQTIGDSPSADTYDIFFKPTTTSYGNNPEYEERARNSMRNIIEYTPFKDCRQQTTMTIQTEGIGGLPDNEQAQNQKVGNLPMPSGADLLVIMSPKNECNAAHFSPQPKIVVWKGNPPESQTMSHEVGHVFGLCDEYNRDIYNDQRSRHGCGNPWPGPEGWYYSGTLDVYDQNNQPVDVPVCEYIGTRDGRGTYPNIDYTYATCGRDIDGDPATRGAAIMGGGGAWSSCQEKAISQPAFHQEAYNHFKQEINARGFQCG